MKKTLTILMCVALAAVFAAGCSQTPSAASDDAAASPSKDTAEYYSTWTKADWDSATPEQKQFAVLFLVSEAAATMGDDEEIVQTTVDDAEESLTEEQYAEIEDAITKYFDEGGEKANLQDSLAHVRGTLSKYVPLA